MVPFQVQTRIFHRKKKPPITAIHRPPSGGGPTRVLSILAMATAGSLETPRKVSLLSIQTYWTKDMAFGNVKAKQKMVTKHHF